MICKHILTYPSSWTVWIDCFNFENARCHPMSPKKGVIRSLLYIYIHILWGWLFYFNKHIKAYVYNSFLHFQYPNSRSEALNMFSILICVWRPNFIFFWIFLLFFQNFSKQGFSYFLLLFLIIFMIVLKNSEKIVQK